jgi:hypothetical protein
MHPRVRWAKAENGGEQADVQSNGLPATYTYYCKWPRAERTAQGYRMEQQGGTDMKGFFNHEGFEVIIWILVIIFLLSIFFDEGID